MQVFDLKTCLPAEPYDLSGRKLLTRNTTRQAWQATFELMKDGARRVAMLGTPGIGKSRSLLGVWHLVSGHRPDWSKEPKAIVFKAWEGLEVFTFSKNKDGRWKGHSLPIGKWDASDCEHLQNSDNWYVVDTYGKETTGKLPVKACSPDRERYTDFVKSGGACVYVEAWKKAELELAYVHFAQRPVDKDTVLRRFQATCVPCWTTMEASRSTFKIKKMKLPIGRACSLLLAMFLTRQQAVDEALHVRHRGRQNWHGPSYLPQGRRSDSR